MRLGKKITGIVLSALMLLNALFFIILMASSFGGLGDLLDIATRTGAPEVYGKQVVVEIFRIIVELVLAILCGIMGGINLGKAVKGRPEAILNRAALFVCFDFIGVAACLATFFGNADTMASETIASYIAYTLTMLIFVVAISVVSTIGRRKAMTEGANKIAAGILLGVTYVLMVTVLIFISLEEPAIIAARESAFSKSVYDAVKTWYALFNVIAWLAACGVLAIAALNLVEGIIAKKRGGAAKPVEEKPAEKEAK